MEPYQDPELVHHTRNVDTYLGSASAGWHGVPQGAGNAPLQQLQQRFEADMSSSVWRAFQGQPHSGTYAKAFDFQTPFFVPGYGDCRRKPVKQRRSHKTSRRSHLDMYLEHSLQEARLGDLWSSSSSTASSWGEPEPQPDFATTKGYASAAAVVAAAEPDYEPAALAPAPGKGVLAEPVQHACSTQGSTATPPSSIADLAPVYRDQNSSGSHSYGKLPAHPGDSSLCDNQDSKIWAEAPGQLNVSQMLLQAFLACIVLLPMLWGAQQVLGASQQVQHSAVMDQVRLWACTLFIPLFLYLVAQLPAESWGACTALLHFDDDAAEARFAAWFATWTWPLDAALCALWTAASLYACCTLDYGGGGGGAGAGPAAPPAPGGAPAASPGVAAAVRWLAMAGVLLPLALRGAAVVVRGRRQWPRRHEVVMVCVKLGYTAVDAVVMGVQQQAAAAALPQHDARCRLWMALVPLVAVALLQIRVSAFFPPQLLHVALVLLGPGTRTTSVAHAAQVLALGLCAPTLWLYAKERRARRQFVALGLAKHAAMLPGAAKAAVLRLRAGAA